MTERDDRHWHVSTDDSGIVWVGLDQAESSTNTLGSPVMRELGDILEEIGHSPPRALIVYSRKDNGFAAGADVKEFTRLESESQAYELVRSGQKVLERLAALPCPTVAMMHGFALGGGFELALACRYRIVADTSGTQLGFPEVKLGIHPGFGGTVRSVAIAGVLPAMDMMLTGRSLGAREARARGLVDKLAALEELKERASNLALAPPSPSRAPLSQQLLSLPPLRPFVAWQLRRRVVRHARPDHYPAPYAIIRLWRRHGGTVRDSSFEAEAHSIARLMCGATARNLVRVFLLQNRLKGLGRGTRFAPKRVHVVGAGTMGAGIAAWCAARGIEVTLQDREARYVEQALEGARKFFQRRFKNDEKGADAAAARLRMDLVGAAVPDAELVIEAIFEDREAKAALFRELEPRLADKALLATNTSSIPLEALSESLNAPQRLVGLHFFNPVARMPLVEVVFSRRTDPGVTERALSAVRSLGKLPVPVRSAPGFLVNRVLAPYLAAALAAWTGGEPLEAIDRAAEDFGMPVGPAELADTVGLDVALKVSEVLGDLVPARMPEAVHRLVDAGHLGRKSGRGLYEWREGKPVKRGDARARDPQLQDLLILPLLNEAVRCLREGVVKDADLLDAGVIFGTGFAPFRGGPIHYARSVGARDLKRKLDALAREHGVLYRPDAGWDRL